MEAAAFFAGAKPEGETEEILNLHAGGNPIGKSYSGQPDGGKRLIPATTQVACRRHAMEEARVAGMRGDSL